MIARLLPILGITFIDILGFSILLPLMPYYVQHFGAPVVVVGILFSTFALCQFVAGPLWGNVSDRIGRKAVLIISQIGATVGWTMLAFAPNIGIVFLARIIEGISGGNISVTQAYVSDLVEPAQRGRAFAYVGASFSAGLVFGPVAGGIFVSKYGFTAPFLAAAALQLLTLILTIAVLPESRKPVDGDETASLASIGAALRDPRVAPVLWQKLVFALGMYAWFAAFVLVLQRQLGLSAETSSYLFAGFGAASVVLQIGVVGRVTDAIGAHRAIGIGCASLILSFIAVVFVHDYVSAGAMILLFSFGLSVANASLPALISESAPDNMRGTVLGVASSLDSMAGVVTPPLSTAVFGRYGTPPTAAMSAAFVAGALVLGIAQMRAPRPSVIAAHEAE